MRAMESMMGACAAGGVGIKREARGDPGGTLVSPVLQPPLVPSASSVPSVGEGVPPSRTSKTCRSRFRSPDSQRRGGEVRFGGTLKLLRESTGLNHCQESIITHALPHPNHRDSIVAHQTLHGIASYGGTGSTIVKPADAPANPTCDPASRARVEAQLARLRRRFGE